MLQGNFLGMEKNLRKEAGMKNWLKGERSKHEKTDMKESHEKQKVH